MTTLTVNRHTADPQRQYILNSVCDASDGINFCTCQGQFENHLSCMFYGRNLEPLAFSIGSDNVAEQLGCTLLTELPREIRQMIWEYALHSSTTVPTRGTSTWRSGKALKSSTASIPGLDIAFGLLQSCKIIYLETYKLPLQLNHYTVYDFQGPFRPDLKVLAPWQAALIQRLDISLQQIALERGELRNWLTHWDAKKRHDGAYVAPLFKCVLNKTTGYHLQPFPFDTLSTTINVNPTDGDAITLPIPRGTSDIFYDRAVNATNFSARAMLACRLTHLTLRLCHEDWWTWSQDPAKTSDKSVGLSLDPAVGLVDGSTWPTCRPDLMEQLAEKRRAGDDVQGHGTWGAIVGKLPDLRELKLVLETFEPKQDELERVVKCAETWQFPIENTPFTLVWDGKVEDASWIMEPKDANGNYADTTSVDEDEGGSSFQVSSEEEGSGNGDDNSEEESEEEDSAEEEREEEGSPEHPSRYWNKLCSRFEVRVMRFVRR
ncbi:hypothetical protein GRF29_28g770579 [Pseudopithomyces chartarum]|uniref:Uncharacterized protein n=1 Tax=Pseudopithomyces chartarum TaxID=1892770 RepID=A0AAN6RKL0_9PLEO|nr:hypothetical protein GRF29_28g770579 [Pseudopithomyces chartarum]